MSYSKQNFRSGDTLYASQLNAMDNEIAALEAEVESTKNMVGSPLTASTAAGMTDQTKIYVYTGSETGYTAGHWYYHNGTAWTDGGVYNSVAVNTDTSLTVAGQAADSKAVGDAIDEIDSDLSDVKETFNDLAEATTTSEQDETTTTLAVTINDGYLASNGKVYHGSSYDTHGYTDIIDVQPGDVIKVYDTGSTTLQENVTVLVTYKSGARVSGAENVAIPYTVPNGVDGIAVTLVPIHKSSTFTCTRLDTVYVPILKPRVDALEAALDNKASQSSVDELASSIGDKVDKSLMQKCTLIETERSANLWNPDGVAVGMMHTNGIVYTSSSYTSFRYWPQHIEVNEGDVLRFYSVGSSVVATNVSRVASFSETNTIMPSSGSEEAKTFTVPAGVKSIVVTVMNNVNSSFMIIKNDSTVPSAYIPYSEEAEYYVASPDFIPAEVLESFVADKVDKDGESQITVKNCEFMYHSPNLFNIDTIVTGLLNKANGQLLTNYTTYRTSDWIEVSEQTNYVLSSSQSNYAYYCWYNANKGFISGYEGGVQTAVALTSPQNAKYFRFSMTAEQMTYDMQFEEGTERTAYMDYGGGYLLPQYAASYAESFPLNLPSKVYATIGTEMNIYFDNLVDGKDTDYDFNTTCTVGMQLERGFRITASTAGTYSLTITATRKSDKAKVSKTASLIVASANAGSGTTASIIVLGDSTTDAGTPISKLHENFTGDAMSVETLGTRGASPNNHEGRSGWKFDFYMNNQTVSQVTNAFYNPSTSKFDASYYFANSGVAKPDYFVINLGINDVFGPETERNLYTIIEEKIDQCDAMISSVQTASPSTAVVVCLTIPPNYSQDAFGKEYKNGQTRARYKRNNILWVQRLIEEYDNRESEGIYVCPINLSLDTIYNMGFETIPVNARNTDITYSSPIGNGGVHPVVSGYWQIADVYKAFLKGNA